jgi:hypothetical protein
LVSFDFVDSPAAGAPWRRFVAGLQHCFQSWRKPFNPILGETWQAALSDGTALFLEQISHHPPISAFQMFGPGALLPFTYHAWTAQPHCESTVHGCVVPAGLHCSIASSGAGHHCHAARPPGRVRHVG